MLSKYGLPQGRVLQPNLFLLYKYVNNMLKLKSCKIVSFVDDMALICNDVSWPAVYSQAENSLLIIKKWLDNNTLSLNVSRTKHMAFSTSMLGRAPIDLNLKLHLNCCIQLLNTCTKKINNCAYLYLPVYIYIYISICASINQPVWSI